MEKKDVRIPKQKRSIEKKERIIKAAMNVFMAKGYFNTSTAEIAKEAKLSTGSFYAYFTDKKSILIECLNRYGNNLSNEICEKIESLSGNEDLSSIIHEVLRIFVNTNKLKKQISDEVRSLQYIDEDVKNYFKNIQIVMMTAITEQMEKRGYTFRNINEQTFILFKLVMSIDDELEFNHSPNINQDILIDECANMIISMLVKKESSQS